MAMPRPEFFDALAVVVAREVPGAHELLDVERLSGGASMETYRLTVATDDGPQPVCMRRGAGGVNREAETAIGLDVEALLMQTAKTAGVPEPTVHYVLQDSDGVGVGIMSSTSFMRDIVRPNAVSAAADAVPEIFRSLPETDRFLALGFMAVVVLILGGLFMTTRITQEMFPSFERDTVTIPMAAENPKASITESGDTSMDQPKREPSCSEAR